MSMSTPANPSPSTHIRVPDELLSRVEATGQEDKVILVEIRQRIDRLMDMEGLRKMQAVRSQLKKVVVRQKEMEAEIRRLHAWVASLEEVLETNGLEFPEYPPQAGFWSHRASRWLAHTLNVDVDHLKEFQ
ncbi:hypothetical protein FA15DRAFT_656760 [Coprinopsis marcescibilis]|uniref:Uncharacterized protein n=1 Tax=Coprinopsis marcescibilis TaxID=230819 RepID=A0A5C3L5D3_COPMA|nr:hypothetical protein FA15DRAFT_656760 [Coprinopsis marcescibilis]